MDRDRLRKSIEQHEGCIDHMYLDTRGNVTIGVGHLVPSIEFAQTLDFIVRDTGEPATPDLIRSDFDNVKAQQVGLVASRYREFTRLCLPHEAIERQLDDHIDEFAGALDREISGFGQMPDSVQEALLDMAFNLGVSGLVRKFPKLVRAAADQDWETCAAECERRGIGDERNRATRQLFEEAENPEAANSDRRR